MILQTTKINHLQPFIGTSPSRTFRPTPLQTFPSRTFRPTPLQNFSLQNFPLQKPFARISADMRQLIASSVSEHYRHLARTRKEHIASLPHDGVARSGKRTRVYMSFMREFSDTLRRKGVLLDAMPNPCNSKKVFCFAGLRTVSQPAGRVRPACAERQTGFPKLSGQKWLLESPTGSKFWTVSTKFSKAKKPMPWARRGLRPPQSNFLPVGAETPAYANPLHTSHTPMLANIREDRLSVTLIADLEWEASLLNFLD